MLDEKMRRWLRSWMREQNLSVRVLALQVGMSPKTVSRWVNHDAEPFGEAAVELVAMVARSRGLGPANMLAGALGLEPLTAVPAPRPPSEPSPPPAPIEMEPPALATRPATPDAGAPTNVDPPTTEHLGATLFVLVEQLHLPPRELRLAIRHVVAAWRDRSWTVEQLYEAVEGLDRRVAAAAGLQDDTR